MKRTGVDVAFILIDEFNVRGVSTALSDGVEPVLQETTPLGVAWPEHGDTGMRKGEFSAGGFYDNATASILDALREQQGVSRVVSYGIERNEAGAGFTGLAGGLTSKFVRTVQMNEFCRANGEYVVSGQVDQGVILHPLGAETTDGDTESDSVDNTAPSAAGGVGYLHVTALTLDTATDLSVSILESVDDVVFTELVAFTPATVATAERVTVAGAVDRYLASAWVWTGGAGGGSTASFFVGFARG